MSRCEEFWRAETYNVNRFMIRKNVATPKLNNPIDKNGMSAKIFSIYNVSKQELSRIWYTYGGVIGKG